MHVPDPGWVQKGCEPLRGVWDTGGGMESETVRGSGLRPVPSESRAPCSALSHPILTLPTPHSPRPTPVAFILQRGPWTHILGRKWWDDLGKRARTESPG